MDRWTGVYKIRNLTDRTRDVKLDLVNLADTECKRVHKGELVEFKKKVVNASLNPLNDNFPKDLGNVRGVKACRL